MNIKTKYSVEDILTLELTKYPCFKKITNEQFYYLKVATKLYLVPKKLIPECIKRLSKTFKPKGDIPSLNKKICSTVKAESKVKKECS